MTGSLLDPDVDRLDALYTSSDVLVITVGAAPLDQPVRAIRVEGAGTLTITTLAGRENTVLYFRDGETRFVGATHITAKSGPTVIEGMV